MNNQFPGPSMLAIADASERGSMLRPEGQLPILKQYWRILIRWRVVIALIIASTLVMGMVVTLLTTPKYTATATVEIARQQERIVDVKSVEPEFSATDQEFYQTQYSLLQARSLAESVVANLRLAEDDKFFQTFGVDPDEAGLLGGAVGRRLTAEQKAKRRQKAADILLENVGISPIRASRLVKVSFTSPDPALSQRIANAWVAAFIESNLSRRFEATAYARRFLENRLEQLRQRLEESERNLVNYASNQRIINISSSESGNPDAPRAERPLESDNLVALSRALDDATADRIRAESRVRSAGGTSVESLNYPALSVLRQKRAEAAAEYAKLLVQFEPEYPAARALNQQVVQLDRAIAREEGRVQNNISGAYAQAVARENALKARVEGLKSGLLDLRRRSIQYNIFQREVDTNRELYNGLLQRYKEIGVAGGVGTNNVSIVDPARLPEEPSSPRLAINMLLALLFGLGLAAAATLALEQVDEGVKDPADVNRATGLPLLGTIPKEQEDRALELLRDRKSSLSEAYLSVQTALQFSTHHGVPKSFAVTSTRPAEGKSTMSFAIAQSLARTGRKVILVEGDMRSPSVHKILGVPNASGLSNYLAGDDTIDDKVIQVEEYGLWTMVGGPQPPSAAELLTGTRLAKLVERLLGKFDHVIVDCPPVLGLADVPLIGNQVEAMIYVVQAQSVRSSLIRASIGRLLSANVNVLGVVLTKFDAKRAHYGYGYDYGYGYGQDDRAEGAAA
jgi:polysaccharide biosynthesis transport protein